MSKRQDVKSKPDLSAAAATGRRRAQAQELSGRQRDAALRNRRLAAELSGGGQLQADADPELLATFGPDVLAPKAAALVTALQGGGGAAASGADMAAALRQLTAVLATGSYQATQAAVQAGLVAVLGALMQQPEQQLPPGAHRQVAWLIELLAANDVAAAHAVLPLAPLMVGGLAASLAAAAGGFGAGLLLAEQLTAALGALAGKAPNLQEALVTQHAAAAPVSQLLLATYQAAAAEAARLAASAVAAAEAAAGPSQQQAQQGQGEEEEEPVALRCCSTALWALAMMVRGRPDQVQQLLGQPALLACLRAVLLVAPPYLRLLRDVAGLLATCGAGGGEPAAVLLAEQGGVVPGLLTHIAGCVHALSHLPVDGEASQQAAQPYQQALAPLLHALSSIAAAPSQVLPLLTELQAARPLPQLPGQHHHHAAGAGDPNVPADPRVATPGSGTGTAADALLACVDGRITHRGVVREAAGVVAALTWGARASPGASAAVCRALLSNGMIAALVRLLQSSGLDIKKEAAAAIANMCDAGVGIADGAGARSVAGEAAGADAAPAPQSLAMLCALGFRARGPGAGFGALPSLEPDIEDVPPGQAILRAYLGLLRSPDADAVAQGLRFVALVLHAVRRGPQMVEELDGIDALEAVQYGTSGCQARELQAWAEELVDTYYGEDYGEGPEDEEEGDEDEMA